MALVPCARCGQHFYASCHDASCIDALCPLCEYEEPSQDDTDMSPDDPRADSADPGRQENHNRVKEEPTGR